MEFSEVPISELKIEREPIPIDPGIDALAANIKKEGQQIGILIDSNFRVIDGARRTRAMQKLGRRMIKVMQTDSFEESCEALQIAREHGVKALPPNPRRVWEMLQDLSGQMNERMLAARRRRAGVPRHEALPAQKRSRTMFSEALGLSSDGYLNAVSTLYKTASEPQKSPAATEMVTMLVKQMELGQMTPFEVRGRLERYDREAMPGDILAVGDQREALATALSQVTGAMKAMRRIGEPNIPGEELALYAAGFESVRRDLTRFIKNLKNRIEK